MEAEDFLKLCVYFPCAIHLTWKFPPATPFIFMNRNTKGFFWENCHVYLDVSPGWSPDTFLWKSFRNPILSLLLGFVFIILVSFAFVLRVSWGWLGGIVCQRYLELFCRVVGLCAGGLVKPLGLEVLEPVRSGPKGTPTPHGLFPVPLRCLHCGWPLCTAHSPSPPT